MKHNHIQDINFDSIILSLCHDIWEETDVLKTRNYSENELLQELVFCILSSQVNFELSYTFNLKIKNKGLLDSHLSYSELQSKIENILKTPININGNFVKFRFPHSKSKQIASLLNKIYDNNVKLKDFFREYKNPIKLRKKIVEFTPGLGMKQGSMFLRNIHNSFELAIIDSHILNYMHIKNLINEIPSQINKNHYLYKENILIRHTNTFGYPIGCVDYAIWIVMRVARKKGFL